MKLQRIKWSVQWIIYSDMETEEKKQEHSNTWTLYTKKSARYQSQRTWFVPQGLTAYHLENSSEETIFHWDTWTIISILGFIRGKKFHIWIYLLKKKKQF